MASTSSLRLDCNVVFLEIRTTLNRDNLWQYVTCDNDLFHRLQTGKVSEGNDSFFYQATTTPTTSAGS
jgi:hypothetical protein